MKTEPLVSIIIPVYNTKKEYLLECLRSVESQDYDNIEVIIVDDGSHKSTAKAIDDFAVNATNSSHGIRTWRVIHQKNMGLSGARNTGFKAASGVYIQFLDADDYFDKKLISAAVLCSIESNAEIVVENFVVYEMNNRSRIAAINLDNLPEKKWFRLSELTGRKIGDIPYSSWSKLFRKDFLDNIKLEHDEDLYRAEDVLFSYTALLQAERISLQREPYIVYRENIANSNSATNDKFPLDSLKSWVKLHNFLIKSNLYTTYKNDFYLAMLDSIYWHLERLHTAQSIKDLGKATQSFIDQLDITAHSDKTTTIKVASISPDLLSIFIQKNSDIHKLNKRIHDLEAELRCTHSEIDILRNPGIKYSAKKLAGVVRRKILRTKL